MPDILVVVGSRILPWLSELFPSIAREDIAPFSDSIEATSVMRTLRLVLDSMRSSNSVRLLRINVLCSDRVSHCVKGLHSLVQHNKVVMITDLSSAISEESSIIDNLIGSSKLFRNLMLYVDSFESLYEVKDVLRSLALHIKTTIVSNYSHVEQDLDLMLLLQWRLKLYGLYLVTKSLNIRKINHVLYSFLHWELTVDDFCSTRWLRFDIAPMRISIEKSQKELTNAFIAMPSVNPMKVLIIARSGVYLSDGDNLEFVELPSLNRIVDTVDDSNLDTILRSLEPRIVFRISKNFTITEDDIELLKLIDRYKCLRTVMSSTGMSYLAIKKRIEELEHALGVKLVVSRRGGTDRGSTDLTPVGRKILEILETTLSIAKRFLDRRLMLNGLGEACTFIDFP